MWISNVPGFGVTQPGLPGWLCQLGDLGQDTSISLNVLIWKMEIILLTLQYEGMHQSSFPQKTLVFACAPPPQCRTYQCL